jgi:putative nucleotidyltransferase with HDIG domain
MALALVLVGAVVAAYHYPIHVRHQTKVALVTVMYYLLAVLVLPALATLAAGLAACSGEVGRRRSSGAYASDIASEVGRRMLIVLIGATIAHAGAGLVPSPIALLGTALALAVLDALSLPLVHAPVSGERPWQVIVATLRTAALAEGVQYSVGIVGAVAATRYVWTLVLLVVPCALVYMACKVKAEMHDSTRQLLESMADAVDLRDPYTGGHSRRVTEYSAAILRELGLHGPEVDLIVTAARVHDIGKIGTPDAILHKPGKLTSEERAVIEEHPVTGATLLTRYQNFARGVALVRHHHESWDGTGYPDRLKGTEIPFGARVIAVADSFDAMTSDRPYRAGMPVAKAAAILRAGRGQQWDAALVNALLRSAPVRDLAAQRGEPLPGGPLAVDAAA